MAQSDKWAVIINGSRKEYPNQEKAYDAVVPAADAGKKVRVESRDSASDAWGHYETRNG